MFGLRSTWDMNPVTVLERRRRQTIPCSPKKVRSGFCQAITFTNSEKDIWTGNWCDHRRNSGKPGKILVLISYLCKLLLTKAMTGKLSGDLHAGSKWGKYKYFAAERLSHLRPTTASHSAGHTSGERRVVYRRPGMWQEDDDR